MDREGKEGAGLLVQAAEPLGEMGEGGSPRLSMGMEEQGKG